MKIFLLDLWQDLREKRLWPVAVGLVLALVAVPVLLAKPFESPAPPPPVKPAPKAEGPKELEALAQVKLAEGAEGHGSALGVFDPTNPFKPPKSVTKEDKPEQPSSGSESNTHSTAGGGTSGSGGSDTGTGGTGDNGGGTTPPA